MFRELRMKFVIRDIRQNGKIYKFVYQGGERGRLFGMFRRFFKIRNFYYQNRAERTIDLSRIFSKKRC